MSSTDSTTITWYPDMAHKHTPRYVVILGWALLDHLCGRHTLRPRTHLPLLLPRGWKGECDCFNSVKHVPRRCLASHDTTVCVHHSNRQVSRLKREARATVSARTKYRVWENPLSRCANSLPRPLKVGGGRSAPPAYRWMVPFSPPKGTVSFCLPVFIACGYALQVFRRAAQRQN